MARRRRQSRSPWLTLLVIIVVVAIWWYRRDREGEPEREPQGNWQWDAAAVALPRTPDTLRIATFNIQVFGQSKLDKPEVMDVLAETVRQFDLIAIQEIRSSEQDVMSRFVERINADGRQYDFVIGPRLGRTTSKEQYAFLFDTDRVELLAGSVYTVESFGDRLHRPPFVASFRARGPPAGSAFTFTLIDMHTDPDETDEELDALADVLASVRRDGEDDVILLGDLNADAGHLRRLGETPGLVPAITGVPTNTRRTEEYDQILLDSSATREFTGSAGVYDFRERFGLSLEQALTVSDHFPVWAEFSIFEERE